MGKPTIIQRGPKSERRVKLNSGSANTGREISHIIGKRIEWYSKLVQETQK
jgi:hypothetical protein